MDMQTDTMKDLVEAFKGFDELDKSDKKELKELDKIINQIDNLNKDLEEEIDGFDLSNLLDDEKIYLYKLKKLSDTLDESDTEKIIEVDYLMNQFKFIYSIEPLFDKELAKDVKEDLSNGEMKIITEKVIHILGNSMYTFKNPRFLFTKLNKVLNGMNRKNKRYFIYTFFKFIVECDINRNSVFISKLIDRLDRIESEFDLVEKINEHIEFVDNL